MNSQKPVRLVGEEARKAISRRDRSGFTAKYLSGPAILDIGFRGYLEDVVPIVPGAIGVELDYPGYDGTTLPFPAESQDTVFASHCLEHIADYKNAISDWFRVLRIGGFLVIMVPHQFLYEKQTGLPSRYNADHKRFYTPASLMAEIEQSLPPNAYRLRHLVDNDENFDYGLTPVQHSGGSYEIELVIEKISPPTWDLAQTESDHVGRRHEPAEQNQLATPVKAEPSLTGAHPIATYHFGAGARPDARLLVLKLDHLGDFVIGLPALQQLRAAFPTGHIRLVVGSWNRIAAEASQLANEVVTYDYFPQNALGWDGTPVEPIEKLQKLTGGRFDLAIDLRVDDDTRHLLKTVDAAKRCGIGTRARFPFLDIAMPPEFEDRNQQSRVLDRQHFFELNQFNSRMPVKTPFYHETSFKTEKLHMIYGPHITLPLGSFTATFDLELTGWPIAGSRADVTIDVARNGEIVAIKRLGKRALRNLAAQPAELSFTNANTWARHEFRVFTEGSSRARVRFRGVRLDHRDAPTLPRLRPAALHIGEQLSMLVQLATDRTRPLYRGSQPPATDSPEKHIIIAPLSNSDLRDWPAKHYAELIRMLLHQNNCRISLVGAPHQAAELDELIRRTGDERITNLAGRTTWKEMPALLRAADLVICNNSGIAHTAAAAGAETLAIYSASHQPQEWGPRGERSHAIMAVVPCSPCGFDRLRDCPNDHTCMLGLAPASVFNAASQLLNGAKRTAEAP